MTITWIRYGETEYVGEITRCVSYQGRINILFKTEIDSDPVEGRLYLNISSEEQESEGVWIFPDSVKEKARFSEVQLDSDEERYPAKIIGRLINFRGKKVNFVGTWKDETEECEIEIDAHAE